MTTHGGAVPLRVLIVDDNLAHARLIRALIEDGFPGARIHHAGRLATALRRLEGEDVDAVLLDLFLPDAQGAGTLEQVLRVAGNVPVLVITALGDAGTVDQALRLGAADVLTKDSLDRELLVHALTRAFSRHRSSAPLFDGATAILGRDAFHWMASKASALAQRQQRAMTLIVLSPQPGSPVTPAQVSEVAQRTFRDSDVIGRVSDIHLAVLLPDDGTNGAKPIERLAARLRLMAPQLEVGTHLNAVAHILGADGQPSLDEVLPVAGERGAAVDLPSRVVVALGDAAAAQELATALRPRFDVFVASSAAELLRVAALEDVSAVVVDDVLAGEGGDSVRRLGQQPETRSVPVLLASDEPIDEVQVRRAGFAGRLPITGEGASALVAEVVARARSPR